MTTMIKKPVADLEGAQLDWAVAMAGEEWKTAHKHFPAATLDPTFKGVRIVDYGGGRLGECVIDPTNPFRQDVQVYNPSFDWSLGGPIIERERIDVEWWQDSSDLSIGWDAVAYPSTTQRVRLSGPTPLIAAMRAFVASKLGDEVKVPE